MGYSVNKSTKAETCLCGNEVLLLLTASLPRQKSAGFNLEELSVDWRMRNTEN